MLWDRGFWAADGDFCRLVSEWHRLSAWADSCTFNCPSPMCFDGGVHDLLKGPSRPSRAELSEGCLYDPGHQGLALSL
jgi:hypothetical protein